MKEVIFLGSSRDDLRDFDSTPVRLQNWTYGIHLESAFYLAG
jgi:hypothetical protein